MSRYVIFHEGRFYDHRKGHAEKTKYIFNVVIIDVIDFEQPTNVSIPSATNPPYSPLSSSSIPSGSVASTPSSTRKVRRLSDIYQRSGNQAHEEKLIGKTMNIALLTKANFEPSRFKDACTNEVSMQEKQEQMDSSHKNDTWELMEIKHDKNKIGTKLIYKLKYDSDGSVERNKERLVGKAFTQKYVIDYEDIFAPVVRQETIRILI